MTELESQNTELPAKVDALTAERDALRSELAQHQDKELSNNLEAAAAQSEVSAYYVYFFVFLAVNWNPALPT